ncbi:MAG: hypothetical protein OXT67_00915 [Zetaproteobacteria bacterium]|nr:hypothetical protein [Zetaproteobacteria bacterium]
MRGLNFALLMLMAYMYSCSSDNRKNTPVISSAAKTEGDGNKGSKSQSDSIESPTVGDSSSSHADATVQQEDSFTQLALLSHTTNLPGTMVSSYVFFGYHDGTLFVSDHNGGLFQLKSIDESGTAQWLTAQEPSASNEAMMIRTGTTSHWSIQADKISQRSTQSKETNKVESATITIGYPVSQVTQILHASSTSLCVANDAIKMLTCIMPSDKSLIGREFELPEDTRPLGVYEGLNTTGQTEIVILYPHSSFRLVVEGEKISGFRAGIKTDLSSLSSIFFVDTDDSSLSGEYLLAITKDAGKVQYDPNFMEQVLTSQPLSKPVSQENNKETPKNSNQEENKEENKEEEMVQKLSFTEDILPVAKDYCIICHNSQNQSGFGDLSKEELWVSKKGQIRESIAEGRMPKLVPDPQKSDFLIKWLDSLSQ